LNTIGLLCLPVTKRALNGILHLLMITHILVLLSICARAGLSWLR